MVRTKNEDGKRAVGGGSALGQRHSQQIVHTEDGIGAAGEYIPARHANASRRTRQASLRCLLLPTAATATAAVWRTVGAGVAARPHPDLRILRAAGLIAM
jgi:hypothetical protein